MSNGFEIEGTNPAAPFTLKLHRGDGMALVAMNWKNSPPPVDFVGFAIEYKEPGGDRFFPLKNRLTFPNVGGGVNPNRLSTRLSPIQLFRWVHFPRNADLEGEFVYRVTPVFMNAVDELSYGEAQEVALELRRETHPGKLNLSYTRGFVSSQAFVERFEAFGPISTLLPPKADDGLTFVPTHPKTKEALAWMGFEARSCILAVLDEAIADPTAQVGVVAYDLSEPELVNRLVLLGNRLRVIIDDDGTHQPPHSGESQAEQRLIASAGAANVKRQHMGGLQHNKMIVVDGPNRQVAVCGSTNFSWRGFYVQANNAVIVQGKPAIQPFLAAFEAYFQNNNSATAFGNSGAAVMTPLNLTGIDAQVAFSPHVKKNALLAKIADDIRSNTTSSLFYSLAFLFQTPGAIRDAINQVTQDPGIFVYGISDKRSGGINLLQPGGNVAPVHAAALGKNAPEPFKSEPTGGGGTRMHHKFVLIDFDKPTARVYLGSYNFSLAADTKNGENLLLIRDRRVAVSYMIEALRIFDHYQFRVAQQQAKTAKRQLALARPPRNPGELPWWSAHYSHPLKIRDRELFA